MKEFVIQYRLAGAPGIRFVRDTGQTTDELAKARRFCCEEQARTFARSARWLESFSRMKARGDLGYWKIRALRKPEPVSTLPAAEEGGGGSSNPYAEGPPPPPPLPDPAWTPMPIRDPKAVNYLLWQAALMVATVKLHVMPQSGGGELHYLKISCKDTQVLADLRQRYRGWLDAQQTFAKPLTPGKEERH